MNIAIFASAAGSNAAKIIEELPKLIAGYSIYVDIKVIITNNAEAGAIKIGAQHNIPTEVIDLKHKSEEDIVATYLSTLKKYDIDFIVLAGYLKKIPAEMISLYPNKIINIHPALLPKYGGKGMYGMKVHEAVIAAGDLSSGITIHYVDEVYDRGKIIFQITCEVDVNDSPQTLAEKIHQLEHKHYPEEIAKIIISQNRS